MTDITWRSDGIRGKETGERKVGFPARQLVGHARLEILQEPPVFYA